MRRLIASIFDLAGYLAGVFMIGTLACVLSSILGRLHPIFILEGAEAYAGYCMAISAFLALAPTLRRGEHIRVTLLLNHLPKGAKHWLDILCHSVAVLLSAALAWYSVRLVLQSHELHDISSSLDATPMWIPQIGMALGTSLFVVAFLHDLVLLLQGKPLSKPGAEGEPARIE
jgi:TRAP-type C4-dicarboxylate transport system permease small subunit